MWWDNANVLHPGQRQSVLRAFREDRSIRVILLSLKAGGEGLNLQAATHVFLLVCRHILDLFHRYISVVLTARTTAAGSMVESGCGDAGHPARASLGPDAQRYRRALRDEELD